MSRTRPTWPELPAHLRAQIEAQLGAPVARWISHDGGFSPGPALSLESTCGDRVFIKAADGEFNAESARLNRREAEIAALLPPEVPTPRLLWSSEVEGWVILAFDAVQGRPPVTPWRSNELQAAADLLAEIAAVQAPAGLIPIGEQAQFYHWRDLVGGSTAGQEAGLATWDSPLLKDRERLAHLESAWVLATQGSSLVHHDFRADNVILSADRALVVDWPHAVAGAAFCDLVGWLPALTLEGGPPPQDMLDSHPVGRAADPEAVTAYLTAIAGYFVLNSLGPTPPGIPHLRAFQRAQGEVCLNWLEQRIGS